MVISGNATMCVVGRGDLDPAAMQQRQRGVAVAGN
jgi:hypothetical protein